RTSNQLRPAAPASLAIIQLSFLGGSCVKVLARPAALFVLSLIVMTLTVLSQTQLGGSAMIQGIVRSKQVPLPGAIVTAVEATSSKTTAAVTEVNGQYQLKVAGPGKYHITVDMTLFMAQAGDVEITD